MLFLFLLLRAVVVSYFYLVPIKIEYSRIPV